MKPEVYKEVLQIILMMQKNILNQRSAKKESPVSTVFYFKSEEIVKMKRFFCFLLPGTLAATAHPMVLDSESPELDWTIYRFEKMQTR